MENTDPLDRGSSLVTGDMKFSLSSLLFSLFAISLASVSLASNIISGASQDNELGAQDDIMDHSLEESFSSTSEDARFSELAADFEKMLALGARGVPGKTVNRNTSKYPRLKKKGSAGLKARGTSLPSRRRLRRAMLRETGTRKPSLEGIPKPNTPIAVKAIY